MQPVRCTQAARSHRRFGARSWLEGRGPAQGGPGLFPALKAMAALLCTIALQGVAQADGPIGAEPFEITGSEVRTLSSSALGRDYALHVKLPPGYGAPQNSGRRYPVILFNDSGYCWLTAVGVTRAPFSLGGYEPAILVGVSYALGEDGVASRVRDYTPTKDLGWRRFDTGGAEAYLRFIEREVIVFLDAEYRTDPERRLLVGHSLGGLFAAYALLSKPDLFSGYLLSSPSLWFDEEAILRLEAEAGAAGRALSGQVFIAVGSTETPSLNGRPHDMVAQAVNFAELLRTRGHDRLEVRHIVYEEGTHLTVYPGALTESLRWMLPGEDVYGG